MIMVKKMFTLFVIVLCFNGTAFGRSPHQLKIEKLYAWACHLKRLVAGDVGSHVVPKRVTLEVVQPEAFHAPVEIKQGSMGVMFSGLNNLAPHIAINSDIVEDFYPVQTRVILHELAHARDPFLKSVAYLYATRDLPMEDGFYPDRSPLSYYPHIEQDALRCMQEYQQSGKENGEPLAYEWHADWQAIQWMKQYFSEDAKDLNLYHNFLIKQGCERAPCPQYPPYEQLVKWLEESA